jgi:hypothetical protein
LDLGRRGSGDGDINHQRAEGPQMIGPTGAVRVMALKDPEFVAKLRNVVGLYVDPPAHAIVLPVDEKSQIRIGHPL